MGGTQPRAPGTPRRDPVTLPRLLTIAGSDSGGGAGVQADLKAFARCGAHGMTAITAVTAQNTVEVTSVHPVPAEVIVDQVAAVVNDVGVDGVKIGMLGDVGTIAAVDRALDLIADSAGRVPVVLDPVMVAESGAALLEPEAADALRALISRPGMVVTPNLAEARALIGTGGDESPDGLVRAVYELGPAAVVLTGGHLEDGSDYLYEGGEVERIEGERHPDGAAHGSGCTHSSVLAARLAWGDPTIEAARVARRVAGEAVRDGLREVGRGAGPVNVLGLLVEPPP